MPYEQAFLKWNEGQVPVLSFHGEELIDQPAYFEVNTLAQDWPDSLPQQMTLVWHDRNDHERHFTGCVLYHHKFNPPGREDMILALGLTTPLGSLESGGGLNLYLGVSDDTIIRHQLQLAGYTDNNIKGLPGTAVNEWRLQSHQENNLQFTQRLLGQLGLLAWEGCTVGGSAIYCHQGAQLEPTIHASYQALAHASSQEHGQHFVTHIKSHRQLQPHQWQHQAYNPHNPSRAIQASLGSGRRRSHQINQQVSSDDQAQQAVQQQQYYDAMQTQQISMRGNDARWYVGADITLEGKLIDFDWHPVDHHLQSKWRLIRLCHRAIYDQRVGPLLGYYHHAWALPSHQPIRPKWPSTPAFSQVLCGIVQADSERSQANLDQQGRYEIAPPSWLIASASQQQTVRLSRLQPFGGWPSQQDQANYETGLHSPLRHRSWVQIGVLNQDPDQPFIIGSWPTPNDQPLAKLQQSDEFGWHSESGQHVRWLDKQQQASIQANTHAPHDSDQGISFQLQPDDTHFKAPNGSWMQSLSGDWTHTSGQTTHQMIEGNDNTTIADDSHIQASQRYHQHTQSDYRLTANVIDYHSSHYHHWQAQQWLQKHFHQLHLQTQQDWLIEATGGNLTLEGNATISSDSTLQIHAGGCGIILDPGGDVTIYGNNIGSISPSVQPYHPKPPKGIPGGPSPTATQKDPPVKPVKQPNPQSEHHDIYKHTLIIDLGDPSNADNPHTQPPILADLFDHVYWTVHNNQGEHLPHKRDGYRLYVNVHNVINDTMGPIHLTPQPINQSLWHQYSSVIKQGNMHWHPPQLPLLIAINQQKRATSALECVPYTIPMEDWFHNKQSSQHQDASGNTLTTDYYHVHLSFMPPAIMLNFRQDAWYKQLPASDKQLYNTVHPQGYMQSEASSTKVTPQDTIPDAMINWFKANGNNVTLFIHGYNVPYGHMGYIESQPEFDDDQAHDTPYAWSLYHPQMSDQKQPQGAFKWLLEMEYNLNQAAGFDGNDYSQYTRLIGIAWQGDPSMPTDYMAATAMTDFPAKKLAAVIQRLQQAGLYVNLMAHSLGNAVLMNTLNRLAQDDTAVDHVFLWEAAIPDNSWDKQTHDYFPMAISDTPSSSPRSQKSSATDTQDKAPANPSRSLPYDYNYPHAHQAVKQVTVLYSGEDTILGASASEQAHSDQSNSQPLSIQAMAQQLIHDGLILTLNHYIPSWLPHPQPDSAQLKRLNQKVKDPGAGLMFALPNLVLGIIDQHGIKGYDDTLPALRSIYHLANWFVYPLSYFLNDAAHCCSTYYQRWQQFYQTWQPANASEQQLPETLEEQKQTLKQSWPKTYQHIHQLVQHIQQLVDEPNKAYPYFDHVFNQLHQATRQQLRSYLPDIEVDVLDWLLSGSVKSDFHDLLHKLGHKYLNGHQAQQLLQHHEDVVTIILTVLMTPQAEPKEAMGHGGPSGDVAYQMSEKLNILNSDPQKDNQGNSVCLDHSAMLVPSDDMKKFVYKETLFQDEDKGLTKFGQWKK